MAGGERIMQTFTAKIKGLTTFFFLLFFFFISALVVDVAISHNKLYEQGGGDKRLYREGELTCTIMCKLDNQSLKGTNGDN